MKFRKLLLSSIAGFPVCGLAALLASAPAHADSCYQRTTVYGDGNQVVNNCTIVQEKTPRYIDDMKLEPPPAAYPTMGYPVMRYPAPVYPRPIVMPAPRTPGIFMLPPRMTALRFSPGGFRYR